MLINEITRATTEQRDGIRQINVAVTQLDTTTQQNAALVEESASAAQSMAEQASMLTELVNTFRLREEQPSAAVPALAYRTSVTPDTTVSDSKSADNWETF